MDLDSTRQLPLDRESRGMRYYRNAVERHWDPHDIELDTDRENLKAFLDSTDTPETYLDGLRSGVARFGAGEQAVTEDLAPLATALGSIDDQMFVTTQIYEEAKHTDFFDRYWREVIHPVEDALGLDPSSPTDETWFNDAYEELFDRNEEAMERLLAAPTAEQFAKAYCHYHLVIEGILAQTGYYGMQQSYSADSYPELPHLPGLCDGFTKIRQDEGRHVGFGMAKLKALVGDGKVDPQLLDDIVGELLPLVDDITTDVGDESFDDVGIPPEELEAFAAEKHTERMEQIKDAAKSVPDLDSLTSLDG
ncbi:probable ribonucleoside-diphosphate reductase beta subunit [Natronomonas pharaonis DSM 2160]|uniref:Probable ribonucleoside-diphosphate reductase beta subunit n=1 Tax=Natronomonas pharaonis (strain ATCC 35678 / DSM 2160 / CIP 103997 / JCM 8858 / NBRC 14720 / NCIMB 2260 / Gabara) TaxID=348780 RepID=A0A1U7EZ92_NATPD|nr:ribonucleotide-diphosphate reductase subunit beta [Natronomonas pharaonis]CAI50624.1 probable ribonucleoside-diphosphate reductase beta subunit [Natronomonas pharaonis DSM 2160]